MKTLTNTPNNQPLRGIELKDMKINTFTFSKDEYKVIVGREKNLNTLYYVTFVNGSVMSVQERMNDEDKKFFGVA